MTWHPLKKLKRAMMPWLSGMMASCEETTRLLSDGMDRTLPLRQRLSIRMHVSMCSLCRRYEKQLRFLRAATHHCAEADDKIRKESLTAEARERLKRALQSPNQ